MVEDIHKSFGDVEALKVISLTAADGDVISMLGLSGSGKSTFLRCINLLEVPNSGTVTVKGETIEMRPGRDGAMEPADRRQVERIRTRLGMVFQSFNLWSHMTIMENVIEAPIHVLKVPEREARDRADAILGMYERREKAWFAHLKPWQG